MITSLSIHFVSCVNQFLVSVSRDLICSVALGLHKIQLFDLAYRLADRPMHEMQDADRIKSDGTSDSKVATSFIIIIYFIIHFSTFFCDLFIYSRYCKITKTILSCNIGRF